MAVRRWGKHARRTIRLITDGELDLVIMELETERLSPEIYRYRTVWGINVVYYVFDFELMENYIFEPIYLNESDILFLGMAENELFQKVLKNTFTMTQPRIMIFPEYLKDLERVSENALIPIIRKVANIMGSIQDKNKQLWCVTNLLGERGAVGGFYKRLLRKFCMVHDCRYLLLGFSNNDYAFLSMMNGSTILAMKRLNEGMGSIRSDIGRIKQKKILIYDFRKDSLEEFEENGFSII